MPATWEPPQDPAEVPYFPLWEYYADPDDVDATQASTNRPSAWHTPSGTPPTTHPRNRVTRPVLPREPNLGALNAEVDRWGRDTTQYLDTTFPFKMDGVTGGKVAASVSTDGSITWDTGLPRYPHCVVTQPRDPVNLIRVYVLPEEERPSTLASYGKTLTPGTLVARVMLWDYLTFPDPENFDADNVAVRFRLPYPEERIVFDWWAWYGQPETGYSFPPPTAPPG